MHLLLFMLGIFVWAVFSAADDFTKNQKLKKNLLAKRAGIPADEYKMAFDKYHEYIGRAESEGWEKIESEIWNEAAKYPAVVSRFRNEDLKGKELLSKWSQSWARKQIVDMGYNPCCISYGYVGIGPAPVGNDYMAYGYQFTLDQMEHWNEFRYKKFKEYQQTQAETLAAARARAGK